MKFNCLNLTLSNINLINSKRQFKLHPSVFFTAQKQQMYVRKEAD